jgi:hypothetical protein
LNARVLTSHSGGAALRNGKRKGFQLIIKQIGTAFKNIDVFTFLKQIMLFSILTSSWIRQNRFMTALDWVYFLGLHPVKQMVGYGQMVDEWNPKAA